MYRMYGMPISPKAPTFGAGAIVEEQKPAAKKSLFLKMRMS